MHNKKEKKKKDMKKMVDGGPFVLEAD